MVKLKGRAYGFATQLWAEELQGLGAAVAHLCPLSAMREHTQYSQAIAQAVLPTCGLSLSSGLKSSSSKLMAL